MTINGSHTKYLTPSIIVISFAVSGCATILKGYYDEVTIQNYPQGTRVSTQDGVEIPVTVNSVGVLVSTPSEHYEQREAHTIKLRSSDDHVLVLRHEGQEKRVHVYPKMEAGWFLLDAVLIVPMIFDLYTGNLNGFEDIDGSILAPQSQK